MITNKDPVDPFPDRPINSNDQSLMQQIVRHRKRAWCGLWSISLLLSLLVGFFVFPQNYTATVSIAMQESSGMGLLSSVLPGASSNTTKYLGVLKSRRFQEEVEKRVHLQELYNLPTHEDALNLIKSAVKIDESGADGLTYVDVTLGAPARFALHSDALREEVRQKDAVAVNVFPDALADYLDTTSSDKDLVLLRFGETEVAARQKLYKDSLDDLMKFLKDRRIPPQVALAMMGGLSMPTTGMSGNSSTPGSSSITGSPTDSSASNTTSGSPGGAGPGQVSGGVAGTKLANLYMERTALELQMDVARKMRETLQAILKDPLTVVPNMPSEDPLLSNARFRYVSAKTTLDEARLRFGPENPLRVTAEAAMKHAEANLKAQAQAMLDGYTTENARVETLKTELDKVNDEIKKAEQIFHLSRTKTAELSMKTNEVALNLHVLETAMISFETMKLGTVTGRKRFNVVDYGVPALHAKPGIGSIVAAALAMAFVSVGLWFGIEFTLKKSALPKPKMNLLAH